MTKSQLSRKLKSQVGLLNSIGYKKIFREKLGNNSLSIFSDRYFKVLELQKYVVENFSSIDTEILEEFVSIIQNYSELLESLRVLSDNVFISNRNKVLETLEIFNRQFQDISKRISGSFLNTNIEQKNKEINTILEELKEQKEELLSQVEEVNTLKNSLEQQAEEYKTRYSNINVNVELETQIYVFKTQAEQNKKESVKWFWGIIGSAVVLFITLILIYCTSELPADFFFDYTFYNNVCETCGEHVLWVDMLKHIFFKLLILSAEIYVLTFCVKNYNACMHNKTNNEHRHNSFSAALHFYNTTTGDKRDEILIKVADAIFTYQKSGYYGKDSEPANPSLIQSVVDKVAGKG